MAIFRTLLVTLTLMLPAMNALAIDPVVYRDCMSVCKQFKGRTCCHESCSYEACMAYNMRTSIGHGSVRGSGDRTKTDSARRDQVDPGASTGAQAACQSWISILNECGGGVPGTPANDETAPTPKRDDPTAPSNPPEVAAVVSIAGTWGSNIGQVYVIVQAGNAFSWTRHNDTAAEQARGELDGSTVKATWRNTSAEGSATGTVTDVNGVATRIDWSNGVVFTKQ